MVERDDLKALVDSLRGESTVVGLGWEIENEDLKRGRWRGVKEGKWCDRGRTEKKWYRNTRVEDEYQSKEEKRREEKRREE